MSKIIRNENPSMCAVCNNICCEQLPGGYSPTQIPEWEQEQLLEKGIVEWDYWLKSVPEEDGSSRFISWFYLRPATKPRSSTCIHYSKNKGCSLSWEKRPYECQALVPKKSLSGRCKSLLGNSKKVIAMAWFLSGRQ